MKKTILPIFVLLFSIVFSVNPSALTLDSSFGVYSQETVLELPLKADPTSQDQSAVSVRLLAKNSEFIDFVPATGENWVGITKDCQEGESYFTSNELCLSLAKSSPLLKDELIGTVKLKVNGIDTAVVSKEEGTKYSNGVASVEDLGVIAEFYTDGSLKNLSFAVSGPIDESINNTNVIILSVGGLAVFALLVLLFIKRSSLKQLLANKKTRVIVLIVGFGVLVATFAGAAVVINNNQALDESSASTAGTCPRDYVFDSSEAAKSRCSVDSGFGYPCKAISSSAALQVACGILHTQETKTDCTAPKLKNGESTSCINGFIFTCRNGIITGNKCTTVVIQKDCVKSNTTYKHAQVTCNESDGYNYKCDNGTMVRGSVCKELASNTVLAPCDANTQYKCDNLTKGMGSYCAGSVGLCFPKDRAQEVNCISGNDTNAKINIDYVCGRRSSNSGGTTTPPVTNNPPTTGGGGTTTNPPVVNNPPTTGGGGTTVATCPSTQPRFLIDLDNKTIGLVAGGAYDITRITKLESVVVINSDPAQRFNGGSVVLTGPNAQGQIVTLATNPDGRTISIAKQTGKYTLVASVGSQECARVSIELTPGKLSNPPGDQVVIGGDTWPCGEMDKNLDGKLTILDFGNFAKIYNKKCVSKDFKYGPCGGADSNLDGKIDVIDFGSFGLRYNKASCAIQ